MIPDDFKRFLADDGDPFQLLTPDAAFIVLCALAALAVIFWPYIK